MDNDTTSPNKTRLSQRSLPFRTGPIIKKLRQEKGLTQKQLADMLNVSRSSIANWETCIRTPRADQYHLLSVIFDVDVKELY